MKKVSKISVISKRDIGSKKKPQIIKDSLTATEKKILIQMLNSNMKQGQVRNKVFHISNKKGDTADVIVGTITKSVILGRKEIVKQKVKIKFS